MRQGLMKSMIESKLVVKKAPNVTGTVCIHFPNPLIQDIQLTNFQAVDVFGRIGVTKEDVKASNIQALLHAGHLVIIPQR